MSPLDGSLQADRNKYRDGTKRSSDAKVMPILEMLVLTSDERMAWNLIKTASDGKIYNCKVLCLVETDDFDIKIDPSEVVCKSYRQNRALQQCLAGSSGPGSGSSGKLKHEDNRRFVMKPDDLGPVPDDPGGGRTIRVEVRTSGQLFLLQTLENGPKHPRDDLRSKIVQHESCAYRRDGWFWYRKRPNQKSYVDSRVQTVSCCQKTGLGRIIRA